MQRRTGISAERVRKLLVYDHETGVFTWRMREDKQWNTRFAGKVAGYENEGYWLITVGGIVYRAHRLAWLYHYGSWPEGDLDHKNLNGFDNSIDNLREATKRQNACNIKSFSHNTSGLKGACWDKNRKKWIATVKKDRRQIWLGSFDSKEEAHKAYCMAASRLHGEFFRV